MSLFAWKDSYCIGVPEIDAQHRKLFGLADNLFVALNSGKGKDVTGKVLDELVNYTGTHFAAEERMMERCGYPDLKPHRASHAELTAKVLQLQQDFRDGKLMLSVAIMQFLSQWLQQHIGGTDRKYVPYVAGKAVA